MTIGGSGFGASPSIDAGDIGSQINSTSSTQIVATLTIPDPDGGGTHGLYVLANGQRSNPANVFIQVPTHLRRFDYPGAPGGVGPKMYPAPGNIYDLAGNLVTSNVCGVYENFAYALYDQRTPPVRITHGAGLFSEVFTNVVITNPQRHADPFTNRPFDPATQIISDINGIWSPFPPCLAPGDTITLDQSFTMRIGSSRAHPLATVVHISVGEDITGVLYVNNNITIP